MPVGPRGSELVRGVMSIGRIRAESSTDGQKYDVRVESIRRRRSLGIGT